MLSPTRFPYFFLNLPSETVLYLLPDLTSTGAARGFIAESAKGSTIS